MTPFLVLVLLFGGGPEDTGLRKRSLHPLRCGIVNRIQTGMDRVYSVEFSRDGKWLLTSGEGASLGIWSTSTFEQVREIDLEAGRIQHAVFSADAKRVLSVSALSRSVFVHEVQGGWERNRFSGVVSYFQSAALSPDGKVAAISRQDRSCVLMDLETGAERMRLVGHKGNVYALAFSEDGRWLATGGGRRFVSGMFGRESNSISSKGIGNLFMHWRFHLIPGIWLVEVSMGRHESGIFPRVRKGLSYPPTPGMYPPYRSVRIAGGLLQPPGTEWFDSGMHVQVTSSARKPHTVVPLGHPPSVRMVVVWRRAARTGWY